MKVSHIMIFIGIGIPIQLFGAIIWSMGEAGANSVLSETSLVGLVLSTLGLILFAIGLCFGIKQNQIKETSKQGCEKHG